MANQAPLLSTSPDPPGIQVIGAGLGRTGTLSFQFALEKLGYKVLHFVVPSHAKQWAEWAEGKVSADDMVQVIASAGYTATCDNPCCDIFAEQLAAFPNAKVVLTVRDNPAKWASSWRTLFNTISITELPFSWRFPSFLLAIPLFRHLKRLRCGMGRHLGLAPGELTKSWRERPAEWLEAQYEAHNDLVKSKVPAERLLVFNVKEGWEPLCTFLGKEVPAEPFPHVNDSDTLKKLRLAIRTIIYMWIPATIFIVGGTVRWLIK